MQKGCLMTFYLGVRSVREPIPSLGFSYPTNTHVSAGDLGRNYQHCVENLDEFSSGNGHWGTHPLGDKAGTRGCWDDLDSSVWRNWLGWMSLEEATENFHFF